MSATAVIPVWNGRPLLMKLLDTLEHQTVRFDEILIVDNGSEDGAADAAALRGARVIRLGRNRGFAHAVNQGVEQARSAKVAILNSDVELDPGWLAHLAPHPESFATGKILSVAQPDLLDGAFDLVCRGGCPWRAGHGKRDAIPGGPIEMASFTAVLFDRDTYLSLGGLDERFESYLEDVDFGFRCAARGVRGVYVPEAVCRHHGSATLGRWNGGSVRRISRNQVYLIAKHYPRALARSLWWPILVAHVTWGLLAIRHGAGIGWLCGKLDALSGFRQFSPEANAGLGAFLERQEALIFEWQQKLGMDWYWRVYFGLAGAKRHSPERGVAHD